jgi:cytidylate kinase
MKTKIIIAIDGFSSTGKSTLAKQLAAHLGYVYVDTGAMYRAVTLFALDNGYIGPDFFDRETLIQGLPYVKLHFEFNPELGFAEMYLNGRNVETEIRSIRVSGYVSRIAEVSEVRAKLVEQQQEMGRGKGIVMDGRDIGTVVFPEAELKIFMTASPETRARRRYDELKSKGQEVTFDEVLTNVNERDKIDSGREDSPLRKADDAIEIDNSDLTREQQLEIVKNLAEERIGI